MPPLISILIPCYNAEPWIQQCIQSAFEQDYPNREVIVLDDGSTDGSRGIIETFGERIRFEPGPHAGGNVARNRLTELAKGEWLQYLDADDYLLPGKLSAQMRLVLERGGGIDVVYGPVLCEDIRRPGQRHQTSTYEGDGFVNYIRWEPFQTTGMLFRREAVLRVGGWRPDQPCCQEHELLLRMLMGGSRCEACHQAGSIYRFQGEGVSHKNPLRTIRMRAELTNRAEEHLRVTGNLTAAHRQALFVVRMEMARSSRCSDPQLAERLFAAASSTGEWWRTSSSALPLRYLLALRILGFQRTERMAAWMRAMRPGF
jgi:hypothetical protein